MARVDHQHIVLPDASIDHAIAGGTDKVGCFGISDAQIIERDDLLNMVFGG